MGKRFHLGTVHFAVQVQALGFFCKNNGNMEILCRDTGDSDAGGLDVRILVMGQSEKRALNSFTDFVDKINVHLMVQKELSTFKMFPGLTIPSLRIRSFKSCMASLSFDLIS